MFSLIGIIILYAPSSHNGVSMFSSSYIKQQTL